MSVKAYRGSIVHCLADPGTDSSGNHVEIFPDGALIVEEGVVAQLGPAEQLLPTIGADCPVTDYRGSLIIPGMVDCHIHYPQTDIIASYGTQLLDWLNTYTFPFEAKFADREYAQKTARFFIEELLRNGTTTALVFATVHAHSVDALFEEASKHDLCIAAGKVLMDRNCPENLRDSAESGYRDSRELIERWHGQGRNHYAITPRFAPTSTLQQLQLAGQLASEFPEVMIQTHLAENPSEIEWALSLFPDSDSYLGIYRDAGLLRERSVFAHCIHLDQHDHQSMAEQNASIAFCPTSNLFLGSGLFDLAAAKDHGIQVGLGTDVGGGTSFSQFRTLAEAYKVLQLQGQSLDSLQGLYLATLAGAQALRLDDKIGNLQPGKDADFVVMNLDSTPLLERRMAHSTSIPEQLFAQFTLADERAVHATYVKGKCRFGAVI